MICDGNNFNLPLKYCNKNCETENQFSKWNRFYGLHSKMNAKLMHKQFYNFAENKQNKKYAKFCQN